MYFCVARQPDSQRAVSKVFSKRLAGRELKCSFCVFSKADPHLDRPTPHHTDLSYLPTCSNKFIHLGIRTRSEPDPYPNPIRIRTRSISEPDPYPNPIRTRSVSEQDPYPNPIRIRTRSVPEPQPDPYGTEVENPLHPGWQWS